MKEQREEERIPTEITGAFLQDGVITHIKVRDKNTRGLGVHSLEGFKPGQQGVVFASWSGNGNAIEEVPTEVCWCISDPMAEDKAFPYRMGLRILTPQ